MTYDITDYQTVDERICEFYKKHPNGALRRIGDPVPWTFGERVFVAYTAGAWRDATTVEPDGMGTAWEPVPGPTPYTKDSELMNAETAAWGRAIIACGAATAKKGISTQEEVRNRSGNGKAALEAPDRGPKFTGSSSEIPAAPKPKPATQTPAAKNTDTSWEVMKDRLTGLQGAGLLDQWFRNTGYAKMTAQMWAALTLANRKVCLSRAQDLLMGTQPEAVAS